MDGSSPRASAGRRTEDKGELVGSPPAARIGRRRVLFGVVSWFCVLVCEMVIFSLWLHYKNSGVGDTRPAVTQAWVYRHISVPVLDSQPSTQTPLSAKDARVVCPILKDIPNLKSITPHLEETSMDATEALVFGNTKETILRVVDKGNRQTEELLLRTREANTSHRNGFLRDLSSCETIVGNYSYLPGGHWKPTYCTAEWKVAIIVPFRNRSFHLPILLRHLVPMLQKQLLDFAIYVVNQENDLPFNRAMLMNVGFLESLNFSKWDCFILHDVDHIPLSELNSYGCNNMPRRMLSGADRWNYTVRYWNFFGAVSGLTRANILRINGFPNVYWGWGGEDDEIFKRVRARKLGMFRTKGPVGYYNVIAHHHKSAPKIKQRYKLVKSYRRRYKIDGLNNIKYKPPRLELHALYTNISVDIQKL